MRLPLEDISTEAALIDSPQEEAVKNIEGAQKFDVSPDFYKEMKDEFAPAERKLALPNQAFPRVRRSIAQSKEHASAIIPEVPIWNQIENLWNANANIVRRKIGPERRFLDLNIKKMNAKGKVNEEFTESDELELALLQAERSQNYGLDDYGVTGFWKTLPGEVAAGVADMITAFGRQKKLTGTTAAVAVGAGALGGPAGARAALGLGTTAIFTWDSIESMSASTYGELDSMVDEETKQPLNIDEDTKRNLAQGVGILGGSISLLASKINLKNVPWLKKWMSPDKALAQEIVSNRALRDSVKAFGVAFGTEGSEEVAQEYMQLIAEEIGRTYKEGEVSFTQGLTRASQMLLERQTQERLLKAGAVGGFTGGTVAGTTQVIASSVEAARERRAARQQETAPPTGTPEGRIVVADDGDTQSQVIEALEFKATVEQIGELYNSTNLSKLSPNVAKSVRRNIFRDSGIKKLWIDESQIVEIEQSNPEVGAEIRAAVDPTTVSLEFNAPRSIEAHKFPDLYDKLKDLSDLVRLEPQKPNPKEAATFVENFTASRARLDETLKRLGAIRDKTPDERAAEITLPTGANEDQIAAALGTREVAQAYLKVLDKREAEAQGNEVELKDIAELRQIARIASEVLPPDVDAKKILEGVLSKEDVITVVDNEEDYINQPTLSQAMRELVGDKAQERFDTAQKDAREFVVSEIDMAAEIEREKLIDVIEDEAVESGVTDADVIANVDADRKIQIVERFFQRQHKFVPSEKYRTPEEAGAKQVSTKPKVTEFAIDPALLKGTKLEKWMKDPVLRRRKVFAKGGLSPDDASYLIGAGTDGGKLLEILATTPTRQEAIDMGLEKSREALRAEIEDNVDYDETSRSAAYRARAANHRRELRYMLDNVWPQFRKGVELVALKLPRVESLIVEARNVVGRTKVRDLNPNQFRVAERRSNNRAVKAIVRQDVPTAFRAKENAMRANELAAQTVRAISLSKRALKRARRHLRKDVMNELREAGSTYVQGMEALSAILNFSPNLSRADAVNSYKKYAQEMVREGKGNVEIPDSLLDLRESAYDLTFDEVMLVTDRMERIVKMARLKNELMLKQRLTEEQRRAETVESFADLIDQQSQAHPEFDASKSEKKSEEDSSVKAKLKEARGTLSTLSSLVTNAEWVAMRFDRQIGGLLNRLIIAPIKGIGKWGDRGEAGKARDWRALQDRFKAMVQKFGEKQWLEMANNSIEVPEFNGTKLGVAQSEASLFMLLLNMGNASNKEQIARSFGVDIEVVREVLGKHMTDKHLVIAQELWDSFDSYKGRVEALQKKMGAEKVEFIEAEAIEIGGKLIKGGYFPLMYEAELSVEKIRERFKDALEGDASERLAKMGDTFYADDMTRHNHTFRRKGSTDLITLDPQVIGMAFENLLHDLNFREPIADGLKILTQEKVAKAITNVVGVDDYNAMVNGLIASSRSLQTRNDTLFVSTQIVDKLSSRLRTGASFGYLVFNTGTMMMQLLSGINVALRLGRRGQTHLGFALSKYMSYVTTGRMGELNKKIAEMNPDIAAYLEGYDENVRNKLNEILPEKSANKVARAWNKINRKTARAGFGLLGTIDATLKSVTTMAAYNQFMAGDASVSLEKLASLTEAERHQLALEYATSLTRQTLTTGTMLDRSMAQHNWPAWTMFFNDARNTLNNIMYVSREAKISVRNRKYGDASTHVLSLIAMLTMHRLAEDLIRGNATPLTDEDEPFEFDADAVVRIARYMGESSLSTALRNMPVVRDVQFAAQRMIEQYEEGRMPSRVTPGNPIVSALGDIAQTVKAGYLFMFDANSEYQMSRSDTRSLLMTSSYILNGIPVAPIMQIYDKIEENGFDLDFTNPLQQPASAEMLRNELDLLEKNQAEATDKLVSEEEMEALRGLVSELESAFEDPINRIPAETYDVIKMIESGGDPYAKNPNSTAVGFYQFLEGTWEDIMRQAPNLNLTYAGRTAADGRQQEKAMRWFTEQNARALISNGIEPTLENLYASHFLGSAGAVKVLSEAGETKLRTLVSSDVMNSNDFSNSMRVKDFKKWLERKVAIGRGMLDNNNPEAKD